MITVDTQNIIFSIEFVSYLKKQIEHKGIFRVYIYRLLVNRLETLEKEPPKCLN